MKRNCLPLLSTSTLGLPRTRSTRRTPVARRSKSSRVSERSMPNVSGRLRYEKDFDGLCTGEVFIETKRSRVHVATDGEVTVMHTPPHYRVRPGALRVLVPKQVPVTGDT